MRSACLALASLLSASAAAAGAQAPATGDVGVSANVDGVCRLGPPSRPSVDLGELANRSGIRVGRLAALADAIVTLPGTYCNFGGTQVTLRAEALVQTELSQPPPGFARAVNYSATVRTWAEEPPLITTTASVDGDSPADQDSGGTEPAAKLTDLVLAFFGFSVPSDARLVAGTYQGLVTITLGPAGTGPAQGE